MEVVVYNSLTETTLSYKFPFIGLLEEGKVYITVMSAQTNRILAGGFSGCVCVCVSVCTVCCH